MKAVRQRNLGWGQTKGVASMHSSGNILPMAPTSERQRLGESLRLLRELHRLSPDQAAAAADVPPTVILDWEAGKCKARDRATIAAAYRKFSMGVEARRGCNFLFGCLPVNVVASEHPEIIVRVARRFNYGSSSWLLREMNDYPLRTEVLRTLEDEVSRAINPSCSN